MPFGTGDCWASGGCIFALRSQPQTREHHRLVFKIMFAQVFRCSTRKSYIFNRGRVIFDTPVRSSEHDKSQIKGVHFNCLHARSTRNALEEQKPKFFMYERRLEQLHFFAESWPFLVRKFTKWAFKYENKHYLRHRMLLSKASGSKNSSGIPRDQFANASITFAILYARNYLWSSLDCI